MTRARNSIMQPPRPTRSCHNVMIILCSTCCMRNEDAMVYDCSLHCLISYLDFTSGSTSCIWATVFTLKTQHGESHCMGTSAPSVEEASGYFNNSQPLLARSPSLACLTLSLEHYQCNQRLQGSWPFHVPKPCQRVTVSVLTGVVSHAGPDK